MRYQKNLLLIPWLLFTSLYSLSQKTKKIWVDDLEDGEKGTVFVHAPRMGYGYYKQNLIETGYGLYIAKEDMTAEDVSKSNIKNLLALTHSFNFMIEATTQNNKWIWAPKISYTAGFFFALIRGDILLQTHDFKTYYPKARAGVGIGFYNIGFFAMKTFSLKNDDPFNQKWGISFATFIWGGKQKWRIRQE